MPSVRTDKQIFPFFDSVKTPVTAAGTSESFYNNGFSTLNLEVATSGSIALYVEGCINILNTDGTAKTDAQCEWTQLAIISLSDYSVSDTITEAGIYAIGINGTARVRVVVTSASGNATIVGVAEV